jgi:hypothetical protein
VTPRRRLLNPPVRGCETLRLGPTLRGVPSTFEPLPPDHPLFRGGVSFVFRSELPQPQEAPEASDPDSEENE